MQLIKALLNSSANMETLKEQSYSSDIDEIVNKRGMDRSSECWR